MLEALLDAHRGRYPVRITESPTAADSLRNRLSGGFSASTRAREGDAHVPEQQGGNREADAAVLGAVDLTFRPVGGDNLPGRLAGAVADAMGRGLRVTALHLTVDAGGGWPEPAAALRKFLKESGRGFELRASWPAPPPSSSSPSPSPLKSNAGTTAVRRSRRQKKGRAEGKSATG